MLFALYISDLGHDLCKSGEGFQIQDVNICSLFFADDIVLLSPSATGLKKLLMITQRKWLIPLSQWNHHHNIFVMIPLTQWKQPRPFEICHIV